MKTIIRIIDRRLTVIGCGLIMIVLALAPVSYATAYSETSSGDRAVDIAKKARDRVERNGKRLKASSHSLFKEFAERTVDITEAHRYPSTIGQGRFFSKRRP